MSAISIIEVASNSQGIAIVEVRQGPVGPAGPSGGAETWNDLTGTADVVPFTTTNGGPAAIGEMAWDVTEETVALLLKNTTLVHLGEDVMYHVENVTGTQIAKGAAVAYAGTVGASGKLRVKLWNGSTDAPFLFMGLASSNIPTDGTGYVTHFGKIHGVNTQAFTAGSILYANPSGTGLTQTAPTQGTTVIAAVCISSSNNGTLIVRPERERVATTAATPNTLVLRNANGGGVLFSGGTDIGAGIESTESTGAVIASVTEAGALIHSETGNNHAQFGQDASTDDGRNRSFVARVKGAFGWFRNDSRTLRIQAADTIAASRTYTIPDSTGTILPVVPAYADLTAANAALAVGDIWWDTTTLKLRTATA